MSWKKNSEETTDGDSSPKLSTPTSSTESRS
jgi:hypothetical protein